jgi:2-polyprenyl-6-methoxyphenol hydroxylase-like FAD-dependent oxidoreductase
MGTFSLLTLFGDNNTWSVTLWAASADTALRKFRDVDCFTKVVEACPLQAHWLAGEPITDVLAMAGIVDRYRRFVVDDQPIATGIAAVGDAWACTNPSAGRGMTVGLVHAQLLRDTVRSALDNPEELVRTFDAATQEKVAPFYFNQIRADQHRFAEMTALRDGLEPPAGDPNVKVLTAAVPHDADAFRALIEMITCLALPQEVFARPGFVDRLKAVAKNTEPLQMPGPNREELLQILA